MRSHRSVITKILCGTLNLEIETGRYKGIPRSERYCTLCKNGDIEDEVHFTLNCPIYDDLRYPLVQLSAMYHPEFLNLAGIEQLRTVFQSEELTKCASSCFNKMHNRRKMFLNAQ